VTLKSEWGDIHAKVLGNLTAAVWKEKRCLDFPANSQQIATSVVNVGLLENLPLLGYIHCWAKIAGDRMTSEYSVL
jgi:hypothetical protein